MTSFQCTQCRSCKKRVTKLEIIWKMWCKSCLSKDDIKVQKHKLIKCKLCKELKRTRQLNEINICKSCVRKNKLSPVKTSRDAKKYKLLKLLNNHIGKWFDQDELAKIYPWVKRIAERVKEWRDIEKQVTYKYRLKTPNKNVTLWSSHTIETIISQNYKQPRAKKLYKDLISNS